MHLPIRLGRDPGQRHEQLAAACERVLEQSKRFVARRSRGLDVFKRYAEHEQFESDAGDYTVVGFDIVPLGPGARSVKRVFDTLFFQVRNIEIIFSELTEHIAIRENDDTGDACVSQHRVVVSITDDILVEANTTVFADFKQRQQSHEGDNDDDVDFGIIVLEWVDDDELYPYRPMERSRRDTSCIFTVQEHSRKRQRRRDASSTDDFPSGDDEKEEDEEEEEHVVVLKRWYQTKLHKSHVHENGLRAIAAMRASIGTWGDRIVEAIYDSSLVVRPRGVSETTRPTLSMRRGESGAESTR